MTKQQTQIQNIDLNQIQQIGEFGVAEMMAMKQTIGAKVTIPQWNLFMYQMTRMGLDPMLGHGVPIPYGDTVNIRVEYEGIKYLAQQSDGFLGIYPQAIHENDDFSAESDEDGVITKVSFKIGKMPRGKVVGSFAVAKREGKKDFIVICEVADFERYAKKNPGFWKLENGSIDPDMAKKFAATRAAKGQYNIADVVDANTAALNPGDGIPGYKPQERKDITAEADQLNRQQPPLQASSKPADDSPKPLEDELSGVDPEIEKLLNDVEAAFTKLGISDKKKRAEYIKSKAPFKAQAPTKAELRTLLKLMRLEIEELETAAVDVDEGVLPGLEE